MYRLTLKYNLNKEYNFEKKNIKYFLKYYLPRPLIPLEPLDRH